MKRRFERSCRSGTESRRRPADREVHTTARALASIAVLQAQVPAQRAELDRLQVPPGEVNTPPTLD